ncbi:MAG TPA: transglutaminase family protein [Candidatus Dormibacteraeota bacterium]|nr:transglutaminase family protein [Candidatus Dormibacteraeota bacterium]
MTEREQRALQDLLPQAIDQCEVDWDRVAGVRYVVRQRFRYEYPRPVTDLRHRLIVVPPDRHGDQRTVLGHVAVSGAAAESRWSRDRWGNVRVAVAAPAVGSWVEFEAGIVVERAAPARPCPLPSSSSSDASLLGPTPLTEPVPALVDAARHLRERAGGGLALAEAVCEWTHGALRYQGGVTDVGTSAGRALELGAGVCQDYAHVMLVLCRLLGLPARYVSGHVMGEGGTHAWVEVVLPDPAGSGAVAVPFDPTYGCRPGLDHVTVATGRDYRDVAPTAGTYTGEPGGRLSASKRMDVVGVEYARGRRTA